MSKYPKAFLAIWHDLLPVGKVEWEKWHTVEHMPERVGIPGFLLGRRYMNHTDNKQCCFTIYESSDLSVFNSVAYLERLNNPTPWTKKNAPTFKNLIRGACRIVSKFGLYNGYSGIVMTIRLLKAKCFIDDRKNFDQLTKNITELDGVTNTTLGLCETKITSTETAERRLRQGTDESSFEGVLIIEGYDRSLLNKQESIIRKIIDFGEVRFVSEPSQIYSLSYMLQA